VQQTSSKPDSDFFELKLRWLLQAAELQLELRGAATSTPLPGFGDQVICFTCLHVHVPFSVDTLLASTFVSDEPDASNES
jgi:hypothetical protein